jgi:hypothetical protein
LKKKKQKTFVRLVRACPHQAGKVFFASFFFRKKKTLAYSGSGSWV